MPDPTANHRSERGNPQAEPWQGRVNRRVPRGYSSWLVEGRRAAQPADAGITKAIRQPEGPPERDKNVSSSNPSHTQPSSAERAPRGRRGRRLRVGDITVVDRSMMRRAISGTIVGNTMEWYDVGVYGYLAVTMGKVFLPTAAPTIQILFSLGVFAATYIARPLGGIVFGRLGDKLGRQKILATTLIMMASSTFLIGVLPDYALVGALGPILLVLLKLVQGFSTGGEYAGATTFISEYSPDRKRGFFASFLDAGSYTGFALGAAVVSLLQVLAGSEAMVEWAWRIPFLVAGPVGVIAIYFRLRIEESPAFQATQDAAASASSEIADLQGRPRSVWQLIARHWRPLLLAMAIVAASNIVAYALTSYMPTYLTDTLGYDPLHGTLLTIPVLIFLAVIMPFVGRISDRVGRRPVLLTGAIVTIVLTIPAFLLIGVGTIATTLAGLSLLAIMVALWVSNQASALPAMFPTSARYGAMGIAFNVAIAIFGGTTPLIIQFLIEVTKNDLAPAWFLMGASVVGAIGPILMKESAKRPLPGALPAVETEEEARDLVEHQDENPYLDLSTMPLEQLDEAHQARLKADAERATREPADSGAR
ncbi:MFS transporter [Schumannella luteola]|nr:MFS transporter [Schumannella luteola]